MAQAATHLFLFFPLLYFVSVGSMTTTDARKTWCVAKSSARARVLMDNINYACSQVNCEIIQKGHPCFLPNKLINHASVAMNLYYQSMGRNTWNCFFANSGLITTTDPSYGNCTF